MTQLLINSAVDIIKALAWPVGIVAIAYKFKRLLPSLVDRVQEVGLTGAKFAPPTAQKEAATETPPSPSNLVQAPQLRRPQPCKPLLKICKDS